jgi:methyl-accepting chemotaxis protein
MQSKTPTILDKSLIDWRTKVLNVALTVSAAAGLPLIAVSMPALIKASQWATVAAYVVFYLLILGVTIFRRLPFALRAWSLLAIIYLIAVLSYLTEGLAGNGRDYLILFSVLAVLLVDVRSGLAAMGISIFTTLVFAGLAVSGVLEKTLGYQNNPLDLGTWADVGGSSILILTTISVLLVLFNRQQLKQIEEARRSSSETGQSNLKLEEIISRLQSMLEEIENQSGVLQRAARALKISAGSVQQATETIRGAFQQVNDGLKQQGDYLTETNLSVQKMSISTEEVARGAQEQARSVGQASSIVSEFITSFNNINNNAQGVQKEAKHASETAQGGTAVVEKTITGMQTIKNRVGEATIKVRAMGERSARIGDIIGTIEEIASQTNLLALNAAIEAARAGVHGKGFAVVADEVRKLADRSARATQEIAKIITDIQATVEEAVVVMESSSADVANGVKYANESGQALFEIIDSVEGVYNRAGRTVNATRQLKESTDTLAQAMDAVSEVVKQNIQASEQMTAGSQVVVNAIESTSNVSVQNQAVMSDVAKTVLQIGQELDGVNQSAQTLLAMADEMQQLVTHLDIKDSIKAASE